MTHNKVEIAVKELFGVLALNGAHLNDDQQQQYARELLLAFKDEVREAALREAAEECYLMNIHGTAKLMNSSADEIKKRILNLIGKPALEKQVPEIDIEKLLDELEAKAYPVQCGLIRREDVKQSILNLIAE